MAPKDTLTPLDYELPRTPKEVMEAWMPRLQAVAIVTALLAGIEAQLLSSLAELTPDSTAADRAVRFFAYSGLLLNLGATLSTILLLIAVASLPTAARQIYVSCAHSYPRRIFHSHGSRKAELNQRLLEGNGETYLLRAFGIARGWGFMLRHCISCFMGGVMCTFVHISINLWLVEDTVVAGVVMPVVFFSMVPPAVAFVFLMNSPACPDCKEDKKLGREEV
ncbi:hypothetical protein LshimejAT787_1201200 [Lyophyllum shimeji]|uniref:Uncharacterized protein n=1 Tax=Lyophyllum shimeji TaxID=47721 RepID=A0A9P3UTZ3_LYOSH|nr:hypothetical protein LshimejAT787_1201200 [Lyophyllum shimeji]